MDSFLQRDKKGYRERTTSKVQWGIRIIVERRFSFLLHFAGKQHRQRRLAEFG
jgi:hypothetical protein